MIDAATGNPVPTSTNQPLTSELVFSTLKCCMIFYSLSLTAVPSDGTAAVSDESGQSQQSGFIFVGAGVGGGVLIVVIFIVIILVCMCWKRSKKAKRR